MKARLGSYLLATGMFVCLFAVHAFAAEAVVMQDESIAQKIEKLKFEAKRSCPHCFEPVPDEEVELPLVRIPKRFLLLPQDVLLDQQSYIRLARVLSDQKNGWRLIHPLAEVGINLPPIEFISDTMRITCASAFALVEYIVTKTDPEYSEFPEAYKLPRKYLDRIYMNEVQAERFVSYPDLRDRPYPNLARRPERFFSLSQSTMLDGELKRVILMKHFPCAQTFPDFMQTLKSDELGSFR